MKINYIFCFLFTIMYLNTNYLYAQQEEQYTQYMYNPESFNPSYVSRRRYISVLSVYRSQWTGIEGSPKKILFSASFPFGNEKSGVGISFYKKSVGIHQKNRLVNNFSHIIEIQDIKLSFGIKTGIELINSDINKLNFFNNNTPIQNLDNEMFYIFGIGASLFGYNWSVGASVPNLIKKEHQIKNSFYDYSPARHLYVTAEYVFKLTKYNKLKQNILYKQTLGAPFSFDMSLNFLFKQKFSLGVSYRLKSAVSMLFSFKLTDNILLGYSYDIETSELKNYNSGSNEFLLRFDLGGNWDCYCEYGLY